MSIKQNNNGVASPLFAVIDLGSNSFHMLITRQLADSVQVVDKVKRKVRLASGLDSDNILDDEAIARGLECLSFFAERLQDIPSDNIRIVATATLRLAKNRDVFLNQANKILDHSVNLLSGEQEAQYIYQGVAHTSCSADKRLVVDIGGASTELIVGKGLIPKKYVSLNIGCVTFNRLFFANNKLNDDNFTAAIDAAKKELISLQQEYLNIGWQTVLGGSGTMQALAEVLKHQHQPTLISKHYLQEIKQQLIGCKTIAKINIAGLSSERSPVIASGLSILIAIFDVFNIDQLQLSNGALREGLLYEMLPRNIKSDVRQRTINSLMMRYHVDNQHANNVTSQVKTLFDNVASSWHLSKDNNYQILLAGCQLHEIGLLLAFKRHQKHSAYIIDNAELPGFDYNDRQLLKAFVQLYKGDIDTNLLTSTCANTQQHHYLLAILRLAVVLCRRRKDDVIPTYQVVTNKNKISLSLSQRWLDNHPLIADELSQEKQHLHALALELHIHCN